MLGLTHQIKQRSLQGQGALVVGNPVPMPKQLPSLPRTEEESTEIATLLKTQAVTRKAATKAAIVQKLAGARIIHLATHGILDDVQGLGSAIALAPSGKDNGLLTAEEILSMKLNADLVVLSACNTGNGRITGDGVIGLSRSFISAGVSSVIVSLWSVQDNPTPLLMANFYRQMLQKPDKAQALRQAMLTTMKQYPSPEYWAAFTLMGEAQ